MKIPVIIFVPLLMAFSGLDTFSKTLREESGKDSLSAIKKEIKVEAPKSGANPALKFSANSIISKSEIRESNPIETPDILKRSPGLFIKDYGGLSGLKTISVRGGSSQQTAIMINGMKISSASNGSIDLGGIPATLTESVEITRGGASTLYGGGALGGSVNFNAGAPPEKISAQFRAGSFGEGLASLTLSHTADDFSIAGGAEYKGGRGDFPFAVNHFGKRSILRRESGDSYRLSAFLTGKYSADNISVKPLYLYRRADLGSPGAVVQGGAVSPGARYSEEENFLAINSHIDIEDGFILKPAAMARIKHSYYSGAGTGLGGGNAAFYSQEYTFSAAPEYKTAGLLIRGLVEGSYTSLEGDFVKPGTDRLAERAAFAAMAHAEFGDYSLWDISLFSASAGMRFDSFSDMGNAFSPFIGALFSFLESRVKLKAMWSHNFRPPNFNEMYYLNYGSASLSPEKSNTANIGLALEIADKLSLEANIFAMSSVNQITSAPTSPVTWSAANIGRVYTRGLELNSQGSLFRGAASYNLAYTLQYPENRTPDSPFYGKIIPYIPQELLFFYIRYGFAGVYISMNVEYTSYRYALPGNSNASLMPEYILTGVQAGYTFRFNDMSFEAFAQAKNIFDEEYQVVLNYPMPGRAFYLGLKFIWD